MFQFFGRSCLGQHQAEIFSYFAALVRNRGMFGYYLLYFHSQLENSGADIAGDSKRGDLFFRDNLYIGDSPIPAAARGLKNIEIVKPDRENKQRAEEYSDVGGYHKCDKRTSGGQVIPANDNTGGLINRPKTKFDLI